MIFNTIMVQLDIDGPAAPRLAFARDLATRFEADLIAFAAAEAQIYVPGEQGGMVAAELLHRRTEEIEARLEALKEEFMSATGDSEHASWRRYVGNPAHLLAIHARAADLLVTGAPAPGLAKDPHRAVDAGTLILSAGRPILFAADSLAPLQAGKVLVAWKDTREARRAVADAMPFLTSAREVMVATILEDDEKAARESAADVVRFLMRHGAKARSDAQDAGSAAATEALTKMARDFGADLIVAGGYGHSRIREWAFGGMTRSLLADGSFHRLFSN